MGLLDGCGPLRYAPSLRIVRRDCHRSLSPFAFRRFWLQLLAYHPFGV